VLEIVEREALELSGCLALGEGSLRSNVWERLSPGAVGWHWLSSRLQESQK